MLHLASKSPRRRDLLRQLGVSFTVLEVEVDERPRPHEVAMDYVRRVARDKARAGLAAVPDALVLGADTEVVVGSRVLGKAEDEAAAYEMLMELSGREHEVLSSVCVLAAGRGAQGDCRTTVRFAKLEPQEVRTYLACGEWRGKAGAYAIQGRAAGFIAGLSGSYSGVVGLPLYETRQLLRELGAVA